MQYVVYKNKEVPNEWGESSDFRAGLDYLSKPEADPSHTCRDWVVFTVGKHRLFLQNWQKSFTCGRLALTLHNSQDCTCVIRGLIQCHRELTLKKDKFSETWPGWSRSRMPGSSIQAVVQAGARAQHHQHVGTSGCSYKYTTSSFRVSGLKCLYLVKMTHI